MGLDPIDRLIVEAKQWLRLHKQAGRHVEALACNIRIKALEDAKKAMQAEDK